MPRRTHQQPATSTDILYSCIAAQKALNPDPGKPAPLRPLRQHRTTLTTTKGRKTHQHGQAPASSATTPQRRAYPRLQPQSTPDIARTPSGTTGTYPQGHTITGYTKVSSTEEHAQRQSPRHAD
ncbi:Hypothetical predicted protein [Pelobates cultripes]|uniref:Uncharacterized protein n=1 Tax=Pelobates cultripes TaxID=61616 RepID=A0AAD1VVC6_PELCU|nr:Hypothetical predicted protein [Pelobates cultripes]